MMKRSLCTLGLIAALASVPAAFAADDQGSMPMTSAQGQSDTKGMGGMGGMQGMGGMGGMHGKGGIQGMGGMQGMGCPMMRMMMGGGMMGKSGTNSIVIPQLPPGNAKLQLEMQGEIMKRVGEIIQRYAAKVATR